MTFSNQEILENFVESVDELLSSDYLKQAKAVGVGTSFSIMKDIGWVTGKSAPDRESLKAAILTIRFFCQDNEPTSLHNMDTLIASLPVTQTFKDRFSTSRAEFKKHLQSKPTFPFPPESKAETKGAVFDTFIYGEFAHAKPEKKRRVKAWEAEPFFGDLCSEFDLTLLNFISCLSVMRRIVAEILATGPIP